MGPRLNSHGFFCGTSRGRQPNVRRFTRKTAVEREVNVNWNALSKFKHRWCQRKSVSQISLSF